MLDQNQMLLQMKCLINKNYIQVLQVIILIKSTLQFREKNQSIKQKNKKRIVNQLDAIKMIYQPHLKQQSIYNNQLIIKRNKQLISIKTFVHQFLLTIKMDIKECNKQKFSKNYKQKGQSIVYLHDNTYSRHFCCEFCSSYPFGQLRKYETQKIKSILNRKLKTNQQYSDINF
ncbi:hypothetical protein TTHERM_00884540 (macronuclear) [Tetrahymena thermophila SB210]|uniref:Uncharacterized protein n=1 Tax=Tetrahymena thermophila (strain SB210) TaxID=312017 RepID=Q23A23_TETTS|nr:hypothetical protein TTHERM_00884540 [Tetrahymena thermophila SB210]EAR93340.2 hypothetical protein TTHERM_00884540 [Tetrahymena thermophila SB210]|eukprot:XP_001013585.2 hypothetical protein TTHERM_00884540 [Tetrahymena thermophila SB210]